MYGVFLRKNIIEQNKLSFDGRLQGGEDMEFMSRYVFFVKRIVSFDSGLYIYNAPSVESLKKKSYPKTQTNVWFAVYSNLNKIFKSKKIREKFVQKIAPHLIHYIVTAYFYKIKERKYLVHVYRIDVNPPWLLKSSSRIALFVNVLIKLNWTSIIYMFSKIFYSFRKARKIEYIDWAELHG